jgi:hypothetical protein
MKVEVKNMGEPAFLTRATLVIPRITPVVEIPSICHDLPDQDTTEIHVLVCDIGYPLEKNVIFLEKIQNNLLLTPRNTR